MIYVMGEPDRLSYHRTFTDDEYDRLPTALPEGAHHGWYVVLHGQSLCIYRASGWCAFQLELVRAGHSWKVQEAWVAARGRYKDEKYVNELLSYIIDSLMFGRSSSWMPKGGSRTTERT
jgi:hypothetical protein